MSLVRVAQNRLEAFGISRVSIGKSPLAVMVLSFRIKGDDLVFSLFLA